MDLLTLALGLLFVILGLVACGRALTLQRRARAARTWPVARGTIVRSEVVRQRSGAGRGNAWVYRADVAYEYEVGDEVLTGEGLCVGGDLHTSSRRRAERRCRDYPVGAAVQVLFDPGQPEHCGLLARAEAAPLMGLVGLVFAVAGTLVAWQGGGASGPAGPVEAPSAAALSVQRTTDALGNLASLRDFSGSWVWVDHEAPWCHDSLGQAPIMRLLADTAPPGLTFVTVITSDPQVMQHATVDTARRWARDNGLAPERVLVGANPSLTVPLHVLLSPSGVEAGRWTGRLDAGTIVRLLAERGAIHRP